MDGISSIGLTSPTPSLLGTAPGQVRFSQHAQDRLAQDQWTPGPQQLDRLAQGVQKASQKGARESLMLMDDRAFIVNVPDKVVITSINQARLRENVFTNIDSAVII